MFRGSNTCARQTPQIPSPCLQKFHGRHFTPDAKKWDRHSCLSSGLQFVAWAVGRQLRFTNTKSAPIQPARPLHHFEKVSYFVRTYVTSSVNESFWSLRNVRSEERRVGKECRVWW